MMTKDEALKLALKALDIYEYTGTSEESELVTKAINACKKALEQPVAEPTVKEKNIMNASLIVEQIKSILNGIDKTETETENGWWETSCGAEFGSAKLKELLALVDKEKNND
jgi:hypothetical protein